MKKSIIILLVCLFLLCGCSVASSSADTDKYADQTAFLRDMAAGITQRLNDDKDSSQMTAKEKADYFLTLVGYELDKVEKYETQVFKDNVFNDLAHLYIDACQTQRFAAQNYKNSALYDALWEGGRKTRSAIIVELYSRYELPITSEQAAQYSSSETTYSIVLSNSNTNAPSSDYSDSISIKNLPVWDEYGYYHYDLLVTNEKADCSLNVTISAVFYDSSKRVIGEDKETVFILGKGETQYCELKNDIPFASVEYEITEATDDTPYLSAIKYLSFHVTTPTNNKVIIEAKNNGEKVIRSGKVDCVFYNGNKIVDTDWAFFAKDDMKLNPGEIQYATCSTNKEYTRYELYYSASY